MIRPPFMARVAAGLALTMLEEARQLPTTAISLPMTSVSILLQTSMRIQQTMTTLAIKGDSAFAFLYPAVEQPPWAVFDEDQPDDSGGGHGNRNGSGPASSRPAEADDASDGAGGTLGRFALYSAPGAASLRQDRGRPNSDTAPGEGSDAASSPDGPDDPDSVVEYIGYDDLTLAQLRPRLRSLSAEDLSTLLAHERAEAGRAPFLTMLENRLASVSAK